MVSQNIINEKHGKAEIGAYAEVEETASSKTVTAHKIEVKRQRRIKT